VAESVGDRDEPQGAASGRDETELERADRNLTDLLGELRVALPGVQVLFAFLLSVPFTTRFHEVTSFQKQVYLATLLCSAVASALLIAPSAHHRVQFRQQDKSHIVVVGNRFALGGLVALALAMTGVVLLVCDVLFSPATTVIATAATAIMFAALWFAVPVRRRVARRR
jgi:hypothetical protein